MPTIDENTKRPMHSHPLLSSNQSTAQLQTESCQNGVSSSSGTQDRLAQCKPTRDWQITGYGPSRLSPEAREFKPSGSKASSTQISLVDLSQPAQNQPSYNGQLSDLSNPTSLESQNELEDGRYNQLGRLEKKQMAWADHPAPRSYVRKSQKSQSHWPVGCWPGHWRSVDGGPHNKLWSRMEGYSNNFQIYNPVPFARQPTHPAPIPPVWAHPPPKFPKFCDARRWLMYELSRKYFVREHGCAAPTGLATLHSRWAAGYVNAPGTMLDVRIQRELGEYITREFPWSQESDPNGLHQIRKYAQHLQDSRVRWEVKRDISAQKEREGEAARVISELMGKNSVLAVTKT